MKVSNIYRTILVVTGVALASGTLSWAQGDPKATEQPPAAPATPVDNQKAAPSDKPAAAAKSPELQIAPGDVLFIVVQEDGGFLNNQYRVNTKGKINFSYVGEFAVEGLTSDEAEAKIKKRLEDDYLQKASVRVEIARPQQPGASPGVQPGTPAVPEQALGVVYVMGKVQKQGPIVIPDKDFTVSKAVVQAGVGEFAKLSQTKLVRKKPDGSTEETVVNVLKIIKDGRRELDVTVQKDDWIIVPQAVFPGPS